VPVVAANNESAKRQEAKIMPDACCVRRGV